MPNSQPQKGTLFAHLDFVLTGMVMNLLGPILPVLSARWTLNDMQAGALIFVQFGASVVGMLLSAPLVERIGYRRTLMLGMIMMSAGVAALARANSILGFAAVCVFGIGFGTNTPATNLFISETNPANRASALNLLNSSWGVGAMGCPLLLALVQRWNHLPWFLYGLPVALVVLSLFMSRVVFVADIGRPTRARTSSVGSSPWSHPLLPLVVSIFFIYVGSENSVGQWVATYAHRIDPSSQVIWALTPSFFWGALLVGRALAPFALRYFFETRVAATAAALAATGVLVLLVAKTMTLVVAGAALAGLGCSCIYPISVSLLGPWFGDAISKLSGTIFATGNLGAAALPWLVGGLSTRFGSLRVGLLVPLVGTLGVFAFFLSQRKLQLVHRATDEVT